ncbi:MAG: barstar family protein [Acidaminococcaceae bacterium]|nr:barstar family protein [Acidaminococcaceae bacterium]
MEIVLDARRFKGRTRAHTYLKEALGLPDYYGKNLDALYDCLGEIAEETVIVVPDVIQKKEYLGDYGRTMLRVFKDAAAENPALQIKIK